MPSTNQSRVYRPGRLSPLRTPSSTPKFHAMPSLSPMLKAQKFKQSKAQDSLRDLSTPLESESIHEMSDFHVVGRMQNLQLK